MAEEEWPVDKDEYPKADGDSSVPPGGPGAGGTGSSPPAEIYSTSGTKGVINELVKVTLHLPT